MPPPSAATLLPVIHVRKIVLTGGPGAGKTTAAREIARRLGLGAQHVPEAATQVYHALGTTWDKLTFDQRCDAQTQMYRLQIAQEEAASEIARRAGVSVLILDRGTLDGAGYWPEGIDAFWPAMGTTQGEQLRRYDAVLWLETAAALGLYDNKASNAIRFESPTEAIAAGVRMEDLWCAHPRLTRVPAEIDFNAKLDAVERAIRAALA